MFSSRCFHPPLKTDSFELRAIFLYIGSTWNYDPGTVAQFPESESDPASTTQLPNSGTRGMDTPA